MTAPHGDDIVRLALAQNPAQAHIWRQALAEEGIQAQAVGDYMDAGYGDIPGMQAEIWVHRSDLDRATEILRQKQPPAAEDAGTEPV